jgi:hypothetical protein
MAGGNSDAHKCWTAAALQQVLIHRRSSLIIISFNSPFSAAAAADGLKGNGANFLNEAGMKKRGMDG